MMNSYRPDVDGLRGIAVAIVILFHSHVALFAVGAAGHSTSGFASERLSDRQQTLLATMSHSAMRRECITAGEQFMRPESACEHGVGALGWAVIGDSHGVELAPALGDQLVSASQRVKQLTFSACAPAYGRLASDTEIGCMPWTNLAVEYLRGSGTIHTVVIAYRLNATLFGDHARSYPRLPDAFGATVREERWHSLVALSRVLVAANKRVILVLQAPELPRHIADMTMQVGQQQALPGVPTSWWEARSAWVNARLHQLPRETVVVDPSSLFCHPDFCQFGVSDTAWYFDDDHPSMSGAKLIARRILLGASHTN